MFFYVLIFVASFFVLAQASGFLVKSLPGLARFFKLSEYWVAFFFVSVATSLPELFVGVSSAVRNIPQFSLGNILGANFVNATLVIGLAAVLGGRLMVDSKISRRNFWIVSGFAFLPLLFAMDGLISRGDGMVLLLLFVFYLLQLRKEKEHFPKIVNHAPRKHFIDFPVLRSLAYFLGGVLFLIFSSYIIVWSGQKLAEEIALNFLSFGIIFVALGTALPEIAFGIRAKMLKHGSMAVGSSLGSIGFNSTFIVGLVSIIRPINIIVSVNLIVAAVFLLLALLAFNFFVFSREVVSRKEGVVLLFIYALFLLFEYFSIIFI